MKKMFYKQPFILLLFSISVLIFSSLYQNTNNIISSTFDVINSYINDSSITDISNKFSEALQSVQLQFSLRFLTGLIGIYINSVLLLLVLKIWNRFSKTKTAIQFYSTTQAFYLSQYVYILNYIILSLYMLMTGSAMDYNQDIFAILYNLWNLVLSCFIVVYYFKIKYGILKPTISYFTLYFAVFLFLSLGGYYKWIIL